MESGTPGVKSTEDGWLNRVVAGVKEPDARLSAPWPWVERCRARLRARAGRRNG